MKKLTEIPLNQMNLVKGFATDSHIPSEEREIILCRLLEMGITPGAQVAVQHRAPFGGSPLAVTVNHNLVGIGLRESELVIVAQEGSTP